MSYSSIILADSPLAYYRLGEPSGTTADNAEGTASRDGTYTGSPTLGATGIVGAGGDTAMTLDGTSGMYVTTSWSTIPTPPLSLECWVKFAASPTDTSLGGWFSEAGVLACQLYLSSGTNVRIGTEQGNANANCTDLLDGNYHHIVGTIDGTNGNARLYYDGSLVAGPTAVTFNGGASVYPFKIGHYWTAGTSVNGTLDEWAVYPSALTSTQVGTHYAAGTGTLPTWTSPANTVSMSTTPQLQFNSPESASAQHFYLQLDTDPGFASGSLRTYDSSADQTNWTYWNGSSWAAIPAGGMASTYAGNEVRYTVTSALTATTWYRRVRAGT